MAFEKDKLDYIMNYVTRDLPAESWYNEQRFYAVVKDAQLRQRIITEFKNARIIYKLFEGMQAQDDLQLAQIRTQVLMFASIQEVAVTHVLYTYFAETEPVKELFVQNRLKKISIPESKLDVLSKSLEHDGKKIIPTYLGTVQLEKSQIRFDRKAEACATLGLISERMKEDLIEIYSYRNTVHIEAEIKKALDYSLKMGEFAYRKTEGLSMELNSSMLDNKTFEA